jgi:two-component system, LytTR family, sensor kinase
MSRLRRTAILAAGLTVPALMIAGQLFAGYRRQGIPFSFAGIFAMELCLWEPWVVAGPFVWDLGRRWPLAGGRRRASLVRHLIAGPIVSFGVLAIYLALYHALVRLPVGWFARFDRSLASTVFFFTLTYFHVELVIYAGIVAVAHAVRASEELHDREREALRLASELTGAKLTALRMQLQPHFLFNTLHTIGSLVLQRQNDRAMQLLAELGELLRATLAHRDTDHAPVREEVAQLRRYLRIEEARFGDRLRVEWAIDPAAEEALIPPFILQPIVENAFRHGIAHRPDESRLRIAAAADEASLTIDIYNDGPPLANTFSIDGNGGYGLHNVRERLEVRNPPGRLVLANEDTGVRATLVLPLAAGE